MRGIAAAQQNGIVHQLAQITRRAARFGHSGELAEFIHDPAQVAGLADDDIGILRQPVRVLRIQLLAVFTLHPLSGQLDRREGVLDLMRDPAGDIAPGGHALGTQQIRDGVEGDDETVLIVLDPVARDTDEQLLLTLGCLQMQLGLHAFAFLTKQLVEGAREFRHQIGQHLAPHGLAVDAQNLAGGGVDDLDPARRVQTHDASADTRQNRLEQAPCLLTLGSGLQQGVALAFDLGGHAVEGAAEHGNLVLARLLLDAHVEITGPDLSRRPCQSGHRARQPVRKPEGQPDSGQYHDQGDSHIDQRKFEQQFTPVLLQLTIEHDGGLRLVQQFQNLAVHAARNVEITIRKGREMHERPKLGRLPILDNDRIPGRPRPIYQDGRRGLIAEEVGQVSTCLQLRRTVDHVGFTQLTLHLRLPRGQQFAQFRWRYQRIARLVAVEVGRQQFCIGGQIAAMLCLIGLRRGEAVADDPLNPFGKPALQPEIHRDRGEDRHQDRRAQGHDGKHCGQA